MPRATAQIVIQLTPNGKFLAEMGSPSGSRRKIDLPDDQSLWGDIIGVELLELDAWLRGQAERKEELEKGLEAEKELARKRFQLSLHRKVWDTTAGRDYGTINSVEFANEKLGSRKDPDFRLINVRKILGREEG